MPVLKYRDPNDGLFKLADGGAPSGPAGGDLAGTYPNPTLAVNRVKLTGDTMTGSLGMSDNNINNVYSMSIREISARSGSPSVKMTSALDMNTYQLTVPTPTVASDAATKQYVDNSIAVVTYGWAGANGFTDVGAPYTGLWCTRQSATGSVITIEGMLARGSSLAITAGTQFQVGTIGSTAWRPQHDVAFVCAFNKDGAAASNTAGTCIIKADGTINFLAYAAGTITTAGLVAVYGSYRGA